MKRLHPSSLILGVVIGLLIAGSMPYLQQAMAEDKKEAISQEELDKNLDAILESQKELQKKLDSVTTQTQFLKASKSSSEKVSIRLP